jgi:hypothetical protein
MSEIHNECLRADPAGMTADDLLAAARAWGLKVFADGDRLVVRGPRDAGADLVQALLGRKAELMPLLALTAEEREYFEERAAIAEFDGGLSRAAAENLAWDFVRANRLGKEAGPA